jgi:hypothetical protein
MNTIYNNIFLVSVAAASLVFLTGCSESNPKPAGFPVTVPCVITMTQEGVPLEGAMVSLIPTDGAQDWLFSAITDASGNARIFTYGREAGAPKGKYKIIVTKTETNPSRFTMPDESDTDAMARYHQNVGHERLNSYTLVESVYTDPNTTPLELEITGRTAETFDVGKKVRILLSAN